MRKGHPMGIVSMLILLVAVVALLPWVVRILLRSVSGFEDVSHTPAPEITRGGNSSGAGAGSMSLDYVPDRNTNYLCSTPNNSGIPCPEGEFCNGVTQQCEKKYIPSMSDIVGYFS
jgi:hypothetical protein